MSAADDRSSRADRSTAASDGSTAASDGSTAASDGTGDPDAPVAWVCLACFAAASPVPADCARDGAPLAPVADPRTLAALRDRLEELATRRETLRFAAALALGATLALATCAALGWTIVPRASAGLFSSTCAWLALLFAVALAAASLALVPPLGRATAVPALLRRLRLDVAHNAVPRPARSRH
jgi:hypothetical protein